MRFLVDENLPSALAGWLRANGHDADHVASLGRGGQSDRDILQFASATGAVILTRDADFDALVTTVPSARLARLQFGNLANPALLVWFETRLPAILNEMGCADAPKILVFS